MGLTLRQICLSSGVVGLEALECVADERQCHFRCFSAWSTTGGSVSCLEMSRIVRLVDLVSWEIGSVDVRVQFRFKWSTNTTEGVKFNTPEEFVSLDFVGTSATKTILGITNQTSDMLVSARILIN